MTTYTRSACRRGLSCERLNLREAILCVAFHANQPIEHVARIVGRSPNYLRKVCGQYTDGRSLPADLVVPLTLATEDFGILDALEREVGRVAVELPKAAAARGTLLDHAINLIQDAGDYLEEARLITRALSQGDRLCDDQQRRLEVKAFELATTAARILALVIGVTDRFRLAPACH